MKTLTTIAEVVQFCRENEVAMFGHYWNPPSNPHHATEVLDLHGRKIASIKPPIPDREISDALAKALREATMAPALSIDVPPPPEWTPITPEPRMVVGRDYTHVVAATEHRPPQPCGPDCPECGWMAEEPNG